MHAATRRVVAALAAVVVASGPVHAEHPLETFTKCGFLDKTNHQSAQGMGKGLQEYTHVSVRVLLSVAPLISMMAMAIGHIDVRVTSRSTRM